MPSASSTEIVQRSGFRYLTLADLWVVLSGYNTVFKTDDFFTSKDEASSAADLRNKAKIDGRSDWRAVSLWDAIEARESNALSNGMVD